MPPLAKYTRSASKTRRIPEQLANNRPVIPVRVPPPPALSGQPRIVPSPVKREAQQPPKIIPAKQPPRGSAAPAASVKLPTIRKSAGKTARITVTRPEQTGAAPKIQSIPPRAQPQTAPKITAAIPRRDVGTYSLIAPDMRPKPIVPPRIYAWPEIETREHRVAREAPEVQRYYLEQARQEASRPDANRATVTKILDLYNASVRNPNATLDEAKKRVQNIDPSENFFARNWRDWGKSAVGSVLWSVALPAVFAGVQGYRNGKDWVGAGADATNEMFRRAWLQYAPPTLQAALHFSPSPIGDAKRAVDASILDLYRNPSKLQQYDVGGAIKSKLSEALQDTLADTGLMPGNSGRKQIIAPELQQKRLNYIKNSSAAPGTKLSGIMLTAYRRALGDLIRGMPSTVLGASVDKNMLLTHGSKALINAFGPGAASFAEELRQIGLPSIRIIPNIAGRNELRELPKILPNPQVEMPPEQHQLMPFEPYTLPGAPIVQRSGPRNEDGKRKEDGEKKNKQQEIVIPVPPSDDWRKEYADRVATAQADFERGNTAYTRAKDTYLKNEQMLADALAEWADLIEQSPMYADIEYIHTNKPNAKISMLSDGDLKNVFAGTDIALAAYQAQQKDILPLQKRLFADTWEKLKHDLYGRTNISADYDAAAKAVRDEAVKRQIGADKAVKEAYEDLISLIGATQNPLEDPSVYQFARKSDAFRKDRKRAYANNPTLKSIGAYENDKKRAEEALREKVAAFANYVHGLDLGEFKYVLENEVVGRSRKHKTVNDAPGPQEGYDPASAKALVGYIDKYRSSTYNILSDLALTQGTPAGNYDAYLNFAADIYNNYMVPGYFRKPDGALKDLREHVQGIIGARNDADLYKSGVAPRDRYYDDTSEREYYQGFGKTLAAKVADLQKAIQSRDDTRAKFFSGGVYVPPAGDSDAVEALSEAHNRAQGDIFPGREKSKLDIKKLDIRELMQQLDPQGTINLQQVPGGQALTELTNQQQGWLSSLPSLSLFAPLLSVAAVRSGYNWLAAKPAINIDKPADTGLKLTNVTDRSPDSDKLKALETYLHDTKPAGWLDNLFGAKVQPKYNMETYNDIIEDGGIEMQTIQPNSANKDFAPEPEITNVTPKPTEPKQITIRYITPSVKDRNGENERLLDKIDEFEDYLNRDTGRAIEMKDDLEQPFLAAPPKKEKKRAPELEPPKQPGIQPPQRGLLPRIADTANYYLLRGQQRPADILTLPSREQISSTLSPVTSIVSTNLVNARDRAIEDATNYGQGAINAMINQGAGYASSLYTGGLNLAANAARGAVGRIPGIGGLVQPYINQAVDQSAQQILQLGANQINAGQNAAQNAVIKNLKLFRSKLTNK